MRDIKLNDRLLQEQGISFECAEAIRVLHHKLGLYLEEPLTYFESYEAACRQVEHIEFVLQDLWNFKPNEAFHSYWNKFKDCECAHVDNQDLWGSGMRSMSSSCPVHEWAVLGIVRGVEIND